MSNKKIAIIITALIVIIFIFAGALAIANHLPLIGKALALIIAVLLIIFIIIFTVLIGRKRK